MQEEGRFVIPDLQRIGKYDILERIADGGFATLYRGRDPFLKRLVAIKVCASEDPEVRQQFLREAEIAGNLDHPSIVRTFDFGFDPVGPYLVQEYLQGEDLSCLIAQRVPLSSRRKLDLLVQIGEGLAYSHDRLVLHLDVKPGNVRVLDRRQAKILDFGIARLATHDPPVPGAMVGTAGYLPPEQMMSKAVDARADVFAFGALAYELLTFARPFAGGTISELLKRVLSGEAEPLTRYWPDCDMALANLIGRCLRRDPATRFPSFAVLLPELMAIRDSYPEVPEAEAPRMAHRVPTVEPPSVPATAAPAPSDADPGATGGRTAGAAAPGMTTGKESSKRRAASSAGSRTLVAGLAAAATVVAIAIGVFLPTHEPIAAAAAAPRDVIVPPRAGGPPPGLLVVTAAPWGEVTQLRGGDGTAVDLPAERVTPLRLWVTPGKHQAELKLAGGAVATCEVDVVSGATQLCAATAVDAAAEPDGDDYFREMGWWR